MREILFRGQRVDNGEWVYGLLWKKKYNSNKIFISYFPDEDDNEDTVVVSPETVGQFTGLHDSTKWEELTEEERDMFVRKGGMPSEWKGRKIFEGDVVEVPREDEHLEVEWAKEEARFIFRGSTFVCDFDNYWANEIEVLGNIHDTEILKGDK